MPARVAGSLTFTGISAGELHTCGTTAGPTFCWGRNTLGQLGTGDLAPRTTPAAIPGVEFDAVSAGYGHSCGVTDDRYADCWGGNAFGQVGAGPAAARVPAPARVTIPAAS